MVVPFGIRHIFRIFSWLSHLLWQPCEPCSCISSHLGVRIISCALPHVWIRSLTVSRNILEPGRCQTCQDFMVLVPRLCPRSLPPCRPFCQKGESARKSARGRGNGDGGKLGCEERRVDGARRLATVGFSLTGCRNRLPPRLVFPRERQDVIIIPLLIVITHKSREGEVNLGKPRKQNRRGALPPFSTQDTIITKYLTYLAPYTHSLGAFRLIPQTFRLLGYPPSSAEPRFGAGPHKRFSFFAPRCAGGRTGREA